MQITTPRFNFFLTGVENCCKRKNRRILDQYSGIFLQHGRDHNIHWQTMNRICSPCGVHYDFIGHLETFDPDLDYILQHFYNHNSATKENFHALQTHGSISALFNRLTAEEFRRVVGVYKKDFLTFGYPLPQGNTGKFVFFVTIIRVTPFYVIRSMMSMDR